MKKVMLYIRVFLQGLLMWCGGVWLWVMIDGVYRSAIEEVTGIKCGTVFYMLLGSLLAAAAVWLLTARRADLGKRISTAGYVISNILALITAGLLSFGFFLAFAYT